MSVIKLDIYSWAGLSFGAIHFYGDMTDGKKFVQRMTRKLSEKDAISINKRMRLTHNNENYEFYKVMPGEDSYCFDTEDDVIACAKERWLNDFPDGEILVNENDRSIIYAKKEG